MADVTLSDLLTRQLLVTALAEQLQGETDPARIQASAAALSVATDELEVMARALEAQHPAAGSGGYTEVVLTPAKWRTAWCSRSFSRSMRTTTAPAPAAMPM